MHPRTLSGLSLVALSLVIAALLVATNKFFLFYVWWWFDIPMHFLGGLLTAGFALWLLRYEVPVSLRTRISPFWFALLATIAVGISWEIFEFLTNSYGAGNYVVDTAADMATDVVGMLAAYWVTLRYAGNG